MVKHTAAITAIDAELASLEEEMNILRQARNLLLGKRTVQTTPSFGTQNESLDTSKKRGFFLKPGSVPEKVEKILQEAGKPLTGEEIVSLLAQHGQRPQKHYVMNALYRCAGQGKIFRKVKPGVFGLLGWR